MDMFAASLRLIHGPVPNLLHALEKEQTSIGRSAGNDLVLADPEVSRRHARIIRRESGFAIEDLGSTNGTFINGRRINRLTRLSHGDIIDLGDTIRLRYEIDGASDEGLMQQEVPAPIETTPQAEPASTAATGPLSSPAPAVATATTNQPPSQPAPAAPAAAPAAPGKRSAAQSFLLGCGVLIALLFICALTFAILDTYQQGRLLYCGPLRPLFEFLLGPFGFAPLCP